MFDWLTDVWNHAMSLFVAMFSGMIVPTARLPSAQDGDSDTSEACVPKLTYFDIKGLAQAVRDTFTYAELDFDDERLTFDEFKERKDTLPYGQLPVLEIADDLVLAQSKTILRFVSKMAHTYPRDPVHAAIIDQWCDVHTEFMNLLNVNMYGERVGLDASSGYDKVKHREWIIKEHVPKYLDFLEADLTDSTWLGKMDQLSMADLCWYPTLCWLRDGTFDGVDAKTFVSYPHITQFLQDVHAQLELPSEEKEEDDETLDTDVVSSEDADSKKDA